MIVDLHAHYHPRAYQEALAKMPGWGQRGGFAGGTSPVTDDAEHVRTRVEMMDDAGGGVQELSPAAGWAPYSEDQSASADAARIGNDTTAELASRMPERFKAFVSLPLPHVDASLKEMARGLDE